MRSEIDRLDREIAELRFLGLRIKELLQSMKVDPDDMCVLCRTGECGCGEE